MTIEAYRKATEILEAREWLEEVKKSLDPEMDYEKYVDVCNRIYKLGYEFEEL